MPTSFPPVVIISTVLFGFAGETKTYKSLRSRAFTDREALGSVTRGPSRWSAPIAWLANHTSPKKAMASPYQVDLDIACSPHVEEWMNSGTPAQPRTRMRDSRVRKEVKC